MPSWPDSDIQPGCKVRLRANPSRQGIVSDELDGSSKRPRALVFFMDGSQEFVLISALERAETTPQKPYEIIQQGRFGRVRDLRGSITFYRLSGKLANLIYSLNTTNTEFLPYQFKPVLNFLDSPSNGVLIADEVGLGKTIEAGLIWTEIRARYDTKRLLVVCPAMLREKWQEELANRFGVKADIVNAGELLKRLQSVRERPYEEFALIASMQGVRPPRNYDDGKRGGAANLARFMRESEYEDSLLDMVIIDEAHYLRNESTQTHELGQLLRSVSGHLLLLTATPIQLRNKDLFNLLQLVDEDAFPFESSFEDTLKANAPLLSLRDRVLGGLTNQDAFRMAIGEIVTADVFEGNQQLRHLYENPPSSWALSEPKTRAEIADRLDRINPLSKVVTRTLKRDVQEGRVVRVPSALKAKMSAVESRFYTEVTRLVREYCEESGLSTGFILTVPQRQMSSCMAAACRAWRNRFDTEHGRELEEVITESLSEDVETVFKPPAEMGSLLSELIQIANDVGSYELLKQNDTKYELLLKTLNNYWDDYPDKKIVLFAFYRQTLLYLQERLTEDGIDSIVLYGGMDKHAIIQHFKSSNSKKILLSSEVASEGVDLQFSSVVINYDLPWNPMRIEQRIGRIDRIGQESERILIWNFVYSDTIDDRIYDRLLERLNIFREALGSMELILGDKIRTLTIDLLGHTLTAEEEQDCIEQTRVALENIKRQQEQLEQEAVQLIAHGEYIQNKVRAARELGRYISGEDLFVYVRDFMTEYFPGTRWTPFENEPLKCHCELSTEARIEFAQFITDNYLQGRTRLLGPRPLPLLFENRQDRPSSQIERVTQEHPLVRFVTQQLARRDWAARTYPVSAVRVSGHELADIRRGDYIYAISRWATSGALDIEQLVYVAHPLDGEEPLDDDRSELLINAAALKGKDWLGAKNDVDTSRAAELYEACRDLLEHKFNAYRELMTQENADRLRMMLSLLETRRNVQTRKIQERIERYRAEGTERKLKMIRLEEGKLNALNKRIDRRAEELKQREHLEVTDNFVAAGLIQVM